ncbi:MAG: alpha/beta hydrolase [Planctomycetota bacterium]|nr:alpha/beta hydrolase [Planctomycetota bacterium]
MKKAKGSIETGRFVVPYRVYGDGDCALVCVSGAQQTMAAWRPFISRFWRTHTVVVFDLPGLGKAEILSGDSHVSLDEQADILHEVMQRLADHRVRILCGASWGTMVSCAYASHRPELVDGMILGSFGVRVNDSLSEIIEEGRRLYEEDEVEQAAHLILERFGQRVSGAYRNGIIQQFRKLGAEQALTLHEHCQFVGSSAGIDEFITLEAIQARTLIVNGAEDPILDAKAAQTAAKRIPDCECIVLDDTGHFLHFERPEILEIYARFIEGFDAPTHGALAQKNGAHTNGTD